MISIFSYELNLENFKKCMNEKSRKNNLLLAICIVISIISITYAQKKPVCVAETEKLVIEADISEKYDTVLNKANECAEQNPKNVEALIMRSNAFALNTQFGPALYDALTAIELAPQSSDAFTARGFVNEQRFFKEIPDPNYAKSAIADYEKALQLNPRNGVALLGKTTLARESLRLSSQTLLPDFNRAIEYLTASGNKAELARAHYQRGITYKLDKQWENAVNDFTAALKLRPGYWSALSLRAETYESRTDKPAINAAIADLTELIRIKAPTYYVYHERRGGLYEKTGDTAKAASDYRAAVALNSTFTTTSKNRLAKIAPAVSTSTTSQTPPNPPKQPTAEQFAAEGRRLASQKKYDEAIKSFSECLRLKPDAVACYAFRGYAVGVKGDLNAAKTDFEAALKLEPNQATIYLIRGMMFVELGNKVEAEKDFRAVLKIDANNQQAKAALQKLGVQP